MADLKISQLGAISILTPATDVLPVVDSGGVTKKITTNQILGSGGTATLASATITGDLTVKTNVLKVDTTNNRVGILTATPTAPLDILGNGLADALLIRGNDNANCKIRMANSGAGGEEFSISVGYPGASNSSLVFRSITAAINRYVIDQTGAHTWATNAGTAMTLNATGLGVGGSPTEKLTVWGTSTVYGDSRFNVGLFDPTSATTGTGSGISMGGYTNGTTVGATFAQIKGIKENSTAGNIAGALVFSTLPNGGTPTERLRIDSSGNVNVSNGNLVMSTSGKGIDFSATPSGSGTMTSELLNDYEEGTFVPTLNSGTFSASVCRYTKIGNMVTVFFDVTVGTGGGDRITNLPFTAGGTVANGIYTNAQDYAAGTTSPVVVVGGSSTTLFFRTVGDNVAFSAMTLTAAANLSGSISYFV